MNSTGIAGHSADAEWSLHIYDAGEPPSATVLALWLLLSLCVTLLFLVVRPAATRRVREDADSSGEPKHTQPVQPQADSGVFAAYTLRLLAAVWTLPLYDVVHRTCCYLRLTPYMLARHRLLPLGASFLSDGLWTEWVNWARLYVLCGASLSSSFSTPTVNTTAATSSEVCSGWQLPLAGVLDYHQYPEYAALNTSRLPLGTEVALYHRMSIEALVITAVTVVHLHTVFNMIHHIFCTSSRKLKSAVDAETVSADEHSAPRADPPQETSHLEGAAQATRINGTSQLTTALRQADTPGDDAWVDSPEALAEEEARRLEDANCQAGGTHAGHHAEVVFSNSHTTRLLQHCWPCAVSAAYAAMYAYVGGLPLLMTMVFPCAIVLTCVVAMLTPT
ncbi:hypothetical protein ABB37_01163 [Leptomonas pyrrhocoris]|uniref:Uncharacterized protein n=1 Tax=Leptomonas pyrrhocoris TaxID=157538 RepID=A0A0M9G885_LEPPY|nr:hypothetical protein ABB37_01163 [Leptomonas pyrrhocoris]KPA84647.1 hypothetical protein ABB37_01163 [Leptomonas pyrrhocoris]|eukprot:XP_015663086.1 hypothetical protein ABB37_01163 [Leptomonas pyrrhocoris]